jgi:hypothetical protein
MSYKRSWRISLVMVLVLMMALGTSLTGLAIDFEHDYSEVWDGSGTNSERFFEPGSEDPRLPIFEETGGWIHWVFSTKGESTDALLVLGGTGSGEYQPGAPLTAEVWHFYTPYFELDGLTATIYIKGQPGPGGGLVISDFRKPALTEELTVSKTVDTSFIREHEWDIEKMVETENEYTIDGIPKIWLFMDGSGNEKATWTIDVTYEGSEDKDFVVSGEVTIKNTGQLDAVITNIEDYLAGDLIMVDFGEGFGVPYTLKVGEELVGTYSEEVTSKIEGINEVTVTTERDEYKASESIVWGEPSSELYKTVNIVDNSDLFGFKALGSVTAPNGDTFTYDKEFSWEDYYHVDGPFSFTYDNTATIVETEQSDSAVLKVNVQKLIFEGETAWAANGNKPGELRYNQRGNWATYVKYDGLEKTTTLFAGQNIDVGTVTFSAPDNGYVSITVNLKDGWEFEDVAEYLKVQDYAAAPSGNPAPGQFDHKISDGNTIIVPQNNFYGVHVNVGTWVPDPNFGPY